MPNGGKYRRFNHRFKGKHKTLALGVYPDVSLAKARARHQEARVQFVEKYYSGSVIVTVNAASSGGQKGSGGLQQRR